MKYIVGAVVVCSLIVSSASAVLVPMGTIKESTNQFICVDLHVGDVLFPDFMEKQTNVMYRCYNPNR